MPTNKEDNVYIKAGETLKIEVVMRDLDGELMNLIGAIAKFGIYANGVLSIRNCTINGSTVIAELTKEETSTLDGNYKYEIVLQPATGERKSIAYGIVVIETSFIPDMFGTNPFPPVIPPPTSGSGTIPNTGWVANVGIYAYKINIDIEGITLQDIVYAAIAQDDLAIAQEAEVAPSCDTYNDGITFYAVSVPSAPMNFSYVVTGDN